MATETRCASGDCPTVGVEAMPLDEFADVDTDDGEMIVYDTDNDDAWIQSDLYYPRATCV
jgi:hypothetical protein